MVREKANYELYHVTYFITHIIMVVIINQF